MAQSKKIIGALFLVTLILEAPSILAGEVADQVKTTISNADECNKQCEGTGTPADIDRCKEKCSLTEHFTYATIGVGACRKSCDELKSDQSAFKSCQEKCREKYEARLSDIKQGKNL